MTFDNLIIQLIKKQGYADPEELNTVQLEALQWIKEQSEKETPNKLIQAYLKLNKFWGFKLALMFLLPIAQVSLYEYINGPRNVDIE